MKNLNVYLSFIVRSTRNKTASAIYALHARDLIFFTTDLKTSNQ